MSMCVCVCMCVYVRVCVYVCVRVCVCFSGQRHADQLRGPLSPFLMGTSGSFPGNSASCIWGRAETDCDGTWKRTGGEVKGKNANGGGSQQLCTVSDTVYPALLPLMRTPRLPAADWTDNPADINGLVHFAGKPNLFYARVPSRSVSALQSVKVKNEWSFTSTYPVCLHTLLLQLFLHHLQSFTVYYICKCLCHGSGHYSWTCHQRDLGSIPGSLCDLWWMKWHWGRFFFKNISFSLSSLHQRSMLIRSSITKAI